MDVYKVGLYRANPNVESLGNFLIRESQGKELKHLQFSFCQGLVATVVF
jgi:hypothetical protein